MRKKQKGMYLLLILLAVTIGYALLSVTLKINGTAGIKSNRWDIHWENVQPNQESTVTAETPVISDNATKVSYEVTLELPGDFYEFTVDAKNDGSIDGKITKVDHTVYVVDATTGEVVIDQQTGEPQTTTLPSYINYSIYYDGTTTPPAIDDVLEAGEKQTYRIRIEYDPEATVLPSANQRFKIEDKITYIQKKKEKKQQTNACGQLQNLVIEDDGSTGLIAVNHEATDNTEALTDYRFTGANPNNYIYFNCGNDVDTSTCERWRIIGCTSDGNMKIIRDSSLGEIGYFVNREKAEPYGFGRNDWSESDIRKELNENYYNNLSASAKSYIVEKDWYVAGQSPAGMFSETAYVAERSNNVAVSATSRTGDVNPIKGKVGLMYASDYGYASSTCHSTCAATTETCNSSNGVYNLHEIAAWEVPRNPDGNYYNYGARACKNSNWLNKNMEEWTMTPIFGEIDGNNVRISTSHMNAVQSNGSLRTLVSWGWTNYRPTVYITDAAKIYGLGTTANPYIIKRTGWVLTNPGSRDTDQKWEYWDTENSNLKDTEEELPDFGGLNQLYHFNDKGYVIYGWHKFNGKTYYSSPSDTDGNTYTDGNVFRGGSIEVTIGVGESTATGTFTFDADGVCTSNNCPTL